jgi:3-oxoadipate enol-lactonase
VVGHSLSTLVAQHLALTRPELVDRLVLVGALAGPAPRDAMRERAELVDREGLDPLAEGWVERALGAETRDRSPELVGLARALFLRNDPAAYAASMRALATVPPIDHRHITQPTLVLVGEEDLGTTPEATRDLAEAIPTAGHEVVPAGAHWVMLDRPREVARAIARHVGL